MEAADACSCLMDGIANLLGQAVLEMACPTLDVLYRLVSWYAGTSSHAGALGPVLRTDFVYCAGAVAAAHESTNRLKRHHQEITYLQRGRW